MHLRVNDAEDQFQVPCDVRSTASLHFLDHASAAQGAAGESSLSLMRLFISCARKIALQSPKETRTRVVGRSLGAEPQATEIVARSFGIVVLFSRMARATRVLVPPGWSHKTQHAS